MLGVEAEQNEFSFRPIDLWGLPSSISCDGLRWSGRVSA